MLALVHCGCVNPPSLFGEITIWFCLPISIGMAILFAVARSRVRRAVAERIAAREDEVSSEVRRK
jgi:hypothetical protein